MQLIKRGWVFEGYDVADIDGYFSLFDIDDGNNFIKTGRDDFSSFDDAIKKGNMIYPEHSPFAVFYIFSFHR